jgi:hypothetical protein
MNNLSSKLGLSMAWVFLGCLVVYIICFSAIVFVNKPFTWSNAANFVDYEQKRNPVFKYIGMASMLLFGLAYTIFTLCLGENAVGDKTLLAKCASVFAAAFCITIGINYFVQLTATRLQVNLGVTEGLSQLTQSFNISGINAVNMLGWTIFYPLSTLFLAFLFNGSISGVIAKWFCYANTAMMLVGFVGYMMNHYGILLITMNLGLGATSIGMLISATIYLKQ